MLDAGREVPIYVVVDLRRVSKEKKKGRWRRSILSGVNEGLLKGHPET